MSSESKTMAHTESIIRATELGKCYKIYNSPKDRLKEALFRGRKQYYREFWALKNISFEVRRGESLGIIGRNGSGKSTLLQLICGTLTPTKGNLSTKGRIAALLELGSGFNPEFTGLENVYLNASLLGLKKEETEEKLEDILGFADIGEFIHQPVKSYSSGMTVRLAFAVIAQVKPDILVVDEALAVGDAIFVQRCMRFIRQMREERCLLFVSHDAEAVKSLCSHALWLSNGSVKSYGVCKSVSLDYLRFCHTSVSGEATTTITGKVNQEETEFLSPLEKLPPDLGDHAHDYGTIANQADNLEASPGWKTEDAEVIEVSISPTDPNKDKMYLKGGEEVVIKILAIAHKTLSEPIIGFALKNNLGQVLFGENTLIARETGKPKIAMAGEKIEGQFRLWFPMLPAGEYALTAGIAEGNRKSYTQHHWADEAAIIHVHSSTVRWGLTGAFITDVKLQVNNGQ